MNLSHLVLREIAHRRLNLLLMLLTIAVAVASAVGLVTLLRGYQVYTTGRVAALDNEIRKITKEMGFNVLILPQDLNLAEFFADDFAEQTMPETHVDLLAQSREIAREDTLPRVNIDVALLACNREHGAACGRRHVAMHSL